MRRLPGIVGVALLLGTMVWSPSTASATNGVPSHASRPLHVGMGGVVRVSGLAGHQDAALRPKARKLKYHGGPVMPSSTTHVIYWTPPGHVLHGPSYRDIIERYFTDTAADSGLTTNVYSVLTQYTDKHGHNAAYDQTYAGSSVDTHRYPKNGCPAYKSVVGTKLKICLTDKQIRKEARRYIATNALPTGIGQAYFMVFPNKVGSCFTKSGRVCAYTVYCAYHSAFGDRSDPTIYANIPYAPFLPNRYCGTPQRPNGPVDGALNSISHEHREMTNDPLLNAWYDTRGFEGSDKCVRNFGPAIGTAPNGQDYNQLINGNDYYVQEEWSNQGRTCKQHLP